MNATDNEEIDMVDNWKISNWNLPNNYYSNTFQKDNMNIKFIFIDTNLFSQNENYIDNINLFYNKEPVLDILDQMFIWLEKELKDSDKYDWIFLSGHDPIASFKIKKEKHITHISNIDILTKFMNLINHPNIIYLCADTHNFQHNIIKFNNNYPIQEFIIGTGGADPDDILPIYIDKDEQEILFEDGNRLGIKMIDTKMPYGYGEFYVDNNIITYNFIGMNSNTIEKLNIDIIPTKLDYKSKYLKYKKKYLAIKKIN
jgi:hypothetical protein